MEEIYKAQRLMLQEMEPLRSMMVEFRESRSAILSSNSGLKELLKKNNLRV